MKINNEISPAKGDVNRKERTGNCTPVDNSKVGNFVMVNYYKTIQINKKQVRLHKYLMEVKIGRKLTNDEVVHHRNGDIHDNRIENLELTTRSEHMKLHPEIRESSYTDGRYDVDIKEVKELYKIMSIKNIAEKLGVSSSLIIMRMEENNIKRNSCGHRYKK